MTPFVTALLIKMSLILSLGLVVTATLRSLSPSFRHLVLYATLASSAALPFVMLTSPQWNVPVLPRSLAAALNWVRDQEPGLTPGFRELNPLASSRVPDVGTNASPSNAALTAKVIDADAAQSPSATRGVLATIGLLPLVWALGFAAVIAWLGIGRIGLRRIARSAWPLDSPDWSGILDEEREYAGVTRRVVLCSSSVVSTPLTWGSRAPVILLPEDALDWPDAHRRIVLRHELAHVARGDSLTQLSAGFVCALYWFHPLVWIAERRLRAECERACDDNVVSLGTPAAEYAAHLLEVARSARAFGAPGFLSVAMARPSQLEGRLLAVLNESRRRVSLSRGARPAAALLSALVLIPLAAFRPVSKTNASSTAGVENAAPNAADAQPTSIPSTSVTPITGTVLSGPRTSMPGTVFSGPLTSMPGLVFSGPLTFGPSTALASAASRSAASSWSAAFSTDGAFPEGKRFENGTPVDTTFQLAVPARLGGTLVLDLKTGGNVIITGWDRPEVSVRASLGGRDWRETEVKLEPSAGGATLESDFTRHGTSQSTGHTFRISVPRNYNVRISSSGGSVSITGVDGTFTGQTGGGEINIQKANGEVDIQTGGGEIHVSDSRLNGSVSTGGGIVRIEGVTGNLVGMSGSGPVITTKGKTTFRSENGVTVVEADTMALSGARMTVTGSGSYSGTTVNLGTDGKGVTIESGSRSGSGSGRGARTTITSKSGGVTTTTNHIDDGAGSSTFGASGIRMNSAGGAISLRAAPDGARVTTGGGAIRIGPSAGEVYAHTGGGNIDIGPATGSVEAHTGAGEVTIELKGSSEHSVDVTSGRGRATLVLPRDLNATLELETAYTENFGKKTRIVSDFPLQTTETADWDSREGTPRRYVRARQTIGRGGGTIRVRIVNGDIVIKRG
jgi:beta-lactamase regulating signal transducer with metallopeptidase domain